MPVKLSKKQKGNALQAVSAGAAGFLSGSIIDVMDNHIPFLQNNPMAQDALLGIAGGVASVWGNDENVKAAGNGLLAVAASRMSSAGTMNSLSRINYQPMQGNPVVPYLNRTSNVMEQMSQNSWMYDFSQD